MNPASPAGWSLPPALSRELEAHARAAHPREACGFLIGPDAPTAASGAFTEVRRAENTAIGTGRAEYVIAPHELLELDDELVGTGRRIVGVYHSHPEAAPVPSVVDRARAWPGFLYLIVGTAGAAGLAVRAWRLKEDRSEFEEVRLVTD